MAAGGKESRVVPEADPAPPPAFHGVLPPASPSGAPVGGKAASDGLLSKIEERFRGGATAEPPPSADEEAEEELALSAREARKRLQGLLPPEDIDDAISLADRTPAGLITARALWEAVVLNGKAAVRPAARAGGATGHRVGRSELLAHLRQQQDRATHCLCLPVLVISFVVIATGIVLHLRLSSAQAMASAIEVGLGTTGLDIGFPDKAWDWLGDAAGNYFVSGGAVVAGGRVAPLPAGSASDTVFSAACHHSAWHFVFNDMWGSEALQPELCRNLTAAGLWFLPWALQEDDAKSLLAQARTTWRENLEAYDGLGVRMLVHNEAESLYALVTVGVELELSGLPSNVMSVKVFDSRPAWMNMEADWGQGRWHLLVIDMIFVTLWCGFAAHFAFSFLLHLKMRGLRSCCSQMPSLWTAIDLLNLLAAVPTIFLYTYRLRLLEGLKVLIDAVPVLAPGSLTAAGWAAAVAAAGTSEQALAYQLDAVLAQASRAVETQEELVWYASVLAILTSLRFFEAFRANPRLYVATRTLQRVSKDVAHFLLVFIVVLSVFVVTGHMIFGGAIKEFSSISNSLGSTLLIIMGYLYDDIYAQMRATGKNIGIVWVWLVVIVFALILLNMLLVIMLDEYMGIRAAAGKAPSLMRQTLDLASSKSRMEELLCRPAEAWPGAPPDVPEKVLRSTISDALVAFSEKAVRRRLEDPALHPDETVTSASLSEALNAQNWAECAAVDRLVAHAAVAAAEAALASETQGLGDALRLCTRLDSNVRDVADDLRKMQDAIRHREESKLADPKVLVESIGDAVWLEKALASRGDFGGGGLDVWDISPPPTPPPEEEVEVILPPVVSNAGSVATSLSPSLSASRRPSQAQPSQGHAGSLAALVAASSPSPINMEALNSLVEHGIDDSVPDEPPPNARGRAERLLAADAVASRLADLCSSVERAAAGEGSAAVEAEADTGRRLAGLEALVGELVQGLDRLLSDGGMQAAASRAAAS